MFSVPDLERRLRDHLVTHAPDDGRRRAAVAIALHGSHVLLMERAKREGDPWSGHISLPGGGFHAADGDLRTTSIRETVEELGIDLAPAPYLGPLQPLQPLMSGPNGVEVSPFVFRLAERPTPRLGPEAAAAFWLDLERAAAKEYDGTFTYPERNMKFPCWNYERHVIWGLTWRILNDLITLAQ